MGSDRPDTDTEMRPLEKMALTLSLALILGVAAFQTLARAHAFPVRSDPRVGWTIPVSPPKVTIWFDWRAGTGVQHDHGLQLDQTAGD